MERNGNKNTPNSSEGQGTGRGSRFSGVRECLDVVRRLMREGRLSDGEREVVEGLVRSDHHPALLGALAEIKFRQKRFIEAMEISKEVLSRQGDNRACLIILGDLHYMRNEYDQALDFYMNARKVKDNNYVLGRLSRTCSALGRFDEAIQLGRMALEREPRDLWAKRYLASALRKAGKRAEALAVLESIVREEPGDRKSYRNYIALKASAGQYEENIKDIDKLMSIPSKRHDVELMILKADILYEERQYHKALMQYEMILDVDSTNEHALTRLGFCYSKVNMPCEAVEILKGLFVEDPSNRYVRSSLFSAYRRLGDERGLLSTLKEAIRRHPGESTLLELVRHIEKKT